MSSPVSEAVAQFGYLSMPTATYLYHIREHPEEPLPQEMISQGVTLVAIRALIGVATYPYNQTGAFLLISSLCYVNSTRDPYHFFTTRTVNDVGGAAKSVMHLFARYWNQLKENHSPQENSSPDISISPLPPSTPPSSVNSFASLYHRLTTFRQTTTEE